MATEKQPEKSGQGQTFGKKRNHIETGPLTADELARARDEGAVVLMMAGCACETGGGVYGKLIVI